MWQNLLRNKYLKNKTLSQVEKWVGVFHFWAGLMGLKDQILNLGKFHLNNGTQIKFWEDNWLAPRALRFQYPKLFNVVHRKHAIIVEVLNANPLNVSFRRALVGNMLLEWNNLVARAAHILN